MSIDERDERLARLDWSKEERLEIVKAIYETGIRIPSICFQVIVAINGFKRSSSRKNLELMKKMYRTSSGFGSSYDSVSWFMTFIMRKSPSNT